MGIISYPQHHKLPATSLFTQQLVQANNKENIKPLPLWGGCGVWSPEYFPHKGPIIQSFRIMAPTCYYIFIKEWICLKKVLICKTPLRWSHNDHDGVSNHQPHHCLLNCLFGRRSKKTSKLRVTCLCAGKSPGTGEFPAQMASNAENVSIWWRHHALQNIQIKIAFKIFTFTHANLFVSSYLFLTWVKMLKKAKNLPNFYI